MPDLVSPRPWRFVRDEGFLSTDLGRIKDANGDTVCSFGYNDRYYATEGMPPTDENLKFLLDAVNAVNVLEKA